MAYQEGQQEAALIRGDFLRKRRLSLGLGVAAVAKAGDRHSTHIHNLEIGQVFDPSISTLITIARGYKIPLVEVLELFGMGIEAADQDKTSQPIVDSETSQKIEEAYGRKFTD